MRDPVILIGGESYTLAEALAVATGQVRGDRADPVQRADVKEPPNAGPDDQDRDVLGGPTPWARCEPRWTQGIQWTGPETVWEVSTACYCAEINELCGHCKD